MVSVYNKEVVIAGSNNGYYYFIDYTHPLATGNSGRVYLHRHLASIYQGNWISSDEQVHHIDEIKTNNAEDNLLICSASEHAELHKGSLPLKICVLCGSEFKALELSQKYCSAKCRTNSNVKDASITKEVLDALIPTMSWVALGKMFGYTDNGIKKRAKSLGCTIK